MLKRQSDAPPLLLETPVNLSIKNKLTKLANDLVDTSMESPILFTATLGLISLLTGMVFIITGDANWWVATIFRIVMLTISLSSAALFIGALVETPSLIKQRNQRRQEEASQDLRDGLAWIKHHLK